MTSRGLPGRRARAAAVALAVVLLGWIVPGGLTPALAADAPCGTCVTVVVISPGNVQSRQTLTRSEIDDAHDLESDEGGGSTTETGNAFYNFSQATSVFAILGALPDPVDVGQVTSADVSNGGFTASLLPAQGDLAEPGSVPAHYSGGRAPAVFYDGLDNQAQLTYARPKRNGGETRGETIPASARTGLTITVTSTAPPFAPQVTGPSTAVVGKAATFSVSYAGSRRPQGQPGGWKYIWSFGDGVTDQTRCDSANAVTTSTVTHRWTRTGGFPVNVAVCGEGQSVPVRSLNPLMVTVGPAPTPTNGPSKGAGNATNGTANGATSGSGKNANGSKNGGTGTTSGAKGSGAAAEAKRSLSSAFGGTTSVTGLLLSADQAVPFSADTGASPSVKAAASRRPGEIPTDWRWLLGLLPVVLLAGGSLRQSRWLAPRLPEPPWRTT